MLRYPLAFYGFVKKDALLLIKRKKYLYTTLLLPLIIAAIFLIMLAPQGTPLDVGVCDFDGGDYDLFREEFQPEILQSENCEEDLVKRIQLGEYSLGVVIPDGFSDQLQDLKQSKLIVYYDSTDVSFANFISWKVDVALNPFKRSVIDTFTEEVEEKTNDVRQNVDVIRDLSLGSSTIRKRIDVVDNDLRRLEELKTDFLLNPIYTDQRSVYEGKTTKEAGIAFIFPTIALFILLMLSSTFFIYDKKNNYLLRVKSGSSLLLYILAKLTFFFLLTIVQFLIVYGIFLLYGATYTFTVVAVLELLLFISTVNVLLGLLIGVISENQGVALLLSLMVSFPLMLLSGVFFPVQTLPAFLQYFVKLLPLHHEILAVKSVLLFGQNLENTWGYAVFGLFFLVYYLVYRK